MILVYSVENTLNVWIYTWVTELQAFSKYQLPEIYSRSDLSGKVICFLVSMAACRWSEAGTLARVANCLTWHGLVTCIPRGRWKGLLQGWEGNPCIPCGRYEGRCRGGKGHTKGLHESRTQVEASLIPKQPLKTVPFMRSKWINAQASSVSVLIILYQMASPPPVSRP